MPLSIDQISDNEILVNGKPVQKDTDGNWIAKIELTTNEYDALNRHLRTINLEDVTNDEKP